MKRFLLALQFLTILPVKVSGNVTEKDLARSIVCFPLAGAVQGALLALCGALLIRIFPPDVTAGILVALLALITGGFDLDGLADTFDALAVKSTGDRTSDISKRLTVMKDSSTGPAGVTALILIISLKFLLVSLLLRSFQPGISLFLLFMMPVFSKWITVAAMFHGKSARQDGLGRIFIESTRFSDLLLSAGITLLLFAGIGFSGLSGLSVSQGISLFFLLIVFFYIAAILFSRFFGRIFNGLTGDHFGAMTEISETFFLMTVYPWLRHSI